MRKIHPITGIHQTLYSMLAEAMADERAKRGILIYFDDEGTMHTGHIDMTLGDTCMANGYIQMMVNRMMEEP